MPSSLPLLRFSLDQIRGVGKRWRSGAAVIAKALLTQAASSCLLSPSPFQAQPAHGHGPLFPFFQLNDLLRIARKIPTFLPYNENKEISHGHGDKNSFVSARANGFKRSGDKGIFQRSEIFRRSGRKGEEAL